MPTRKLLFRVLLWSLGIAAVSGVGAALLGSIESIWRVPTTAIATAVAAGLMLIASVLADRPKVREAGLTGMALVVALYLLTLALTWVPGQGLRFEQSIGLTILFLGICGVVAVGYLSLIRLRNAMVAGWTGVGLAATCLAIWLTATWLDLSWRWYEVGWALAGIGTLATICLVGAGNDRRHWRWVGVGASALAVAMAAVGILYSLSGDPTAFAVALVTACVVAHANVVVRCPLTSGQLWLRYVTVAAGMMTGALLAVIAGLDYRSTWENDYPWRGTIELLGRLASATGIVAGCGTLALAVLARLNRRIERPDTPVADFKQITLVCPLCKKKQSQPIGEGHCSTCGLIFRLGLDEPRCPTCGYSLLLLTSERCPECGTLIRPTADQQIEKVKALSDAHAVPGQSNDPL